VPGNRHTGLFIEEGSGGLLNDLYFYGGGNATVLGNQQYTARNLWFSNADVAIWMTWNWGWTFKSAFFKDCRVGIKMDDVSNAVGSITMLDSTFENVGIAIMTTRARIGALGSGASFTMENVRFQGVTGVIVDSSGVDLLGNALTPDSSDVFVMVCFAKQRIPKF
jgi:glucan 1,3-beta-glucosidase